MVEAVQEVTEVFDGWCWFGGRDVVPDGGEGASDGDGLVNLRGEPGGGCVAFGESGGELGDFVDTVVQGHPTSEDSSLTTPGGSTSRDSLRTT